MSARIDRRRFLRQSGLATLGLTLLPERRLWAETRFDLVIRGGVILDGTGAPAWPADLGVAGGSIAALGSIDPEQGREVIDASGLYVAPGFIDIHSHSDDSILRYPTADSRVRQGITTEVTGNCGYSAAPLAGEAGERRKEKLAKDLQIEATWSDVASYLRALDELQVATNQALLLGQGVLRENVVGEEDRPASPDEMRALLRAVEEGLDDGAFGLSTGLEYAPGIFTPREEIVAMARVVARRGGLYASHIRNEEAALLEAVDAAIDIGRRSGVRVEISHLKAAGRPNWSKQPASLDLIVPADQVGLADRGRIARGKKADLVIFDTATVADLATFDDPHRYPAGIRHVLVNGTAVVENGEPTGARPGQVLRPS